MKIQLNKKLLPIKAHFFFFFAALGPILPQLNVFGRQLGVSPAAMGMVTAVLPLLWALAKPLFGYVVDFWPTQRKLIFMLLIATMSGSYCCLWFLPMPDLEPHTPITESVYLLNDTIHLKAYDSKIAAIDKYACHWNCSDSDSDTTVSDLTYFDVYLSNLTVVNTVYVDGVVRNLSCSVLGMELSEDRDGEVICLTKEGCNLLCFEEELRSRRDLDNVLKSTKDGAQNSAKDGALKSAKDNVLNTKDNKDGEFKSAKNDALNSTKDSALKSAKDNVLNTKDNVLKINLNDTLKSAKIDALESTKKNALNTNDNMQKTNRNDTPNSGKNEALESAKDDVLKTNDNVQKTNRNDTLKSAKNDALGSNKDNMQKNNTDEIPNSGKNEALKSAKDNVLNTNDNVQKIIIDNEPNSAKKDALQSTKDNVQKTNREDAPNSAKNDELQSPKHGALNSAKDNVINTKDNALKSSKVDPLESTKENALGSTKDSVVSAKDSVLNSGESTVVLKSDNFYMTATFWAFVVLMCVGTVAFNVANCIGDAVCFDVLGDEGSKYGAQRAWGTAGYGLTALAGGWLIDLVSGHDYKNFTPAFVIVIVATIVDLYSCRRLHLPSLSSPSDSGKALCDVLKIPRVVVFIIFAIVAGTFDSFIIYYMFWFLEELAEETGHTGKIKLIEGVVVAAQSFIGELLFFFYSGKIINRWGYGTTLTFSLFCYGVRMALISLIRDPWHLVFIEGIMQGPTYALCYSTIVGYAAHVAPEGYSATVQGIVAGVDDGLGFAIGSLVGGQLYSYFGGRGAFRLFAIVAGVGALLHWILFRLVTRNESKPEENQEIEEDEKMLPENYQVVYRDTVEPIKDDRSFHTSPSSSKLSN